MPDGLTLRDLRYLIDRAGDYRAGESMAVPAATVSRLANELMDARMRIAELEAAQRPPAEGEIAELRAAVLYSYQAGEPDLPSITSDWVRGIVSQPDGGLVDVIDALAAAQRPPLGYADGSLFVAAGDTEYRHIGDLTDPYAEVTQHILGTRRYWGGVIYASTITKEVFDATAFTSAWVVWGGVFMRINGMGNSTPGPGDRPWRIECSQRQRVGYAQIDGRSVYLDLIEPSPPMPTEPWWVPERARALRELIGTGPRPRSVLVPGMDGSLVSIDPWEVQP